jgi:hypothetical protein
MYTSLSERTPPPHTSAARPRRPRLVDSSRLVLHHSLHAKAMLVIVFVL